MRVPEREWVTESRYGTILYFAQIAEEMFWHGARDSYRPPSLDSYHRSVELSKIYSELKDAGLIDGTTGTGSQIILPMFDEFLSFLSRDLTIKRHYSEMLEIVSHHLGDKQAGVFPKIRAVRLFERTISPLYLRRCRDEIEGYAGNEKPKDKAAFRILVANYFSYLLNVGHTPEYIYFNTQRHFFDRDLQESPRRELQNFFKCFPGRQNEYRVFVGVSREMHAALDGIEGVNPRPALPSSARLRHAALLNEWKNTIELSPIHAMDLPGAWLECDRSLGLTRALAYTGKPAADLSWHPIMVVTSEDHEAGSEFGEPTSPLRQRYRGNPSAADKLVGDRRAIISRKILTDADRNRLLNAIVGYADAFHSESPASQLVSLWSSLEGLLPSPPSDVNRIGSFVRDVATGQQRTYLENQFNWLYVDLRKIYRETLSDVLKDISEYQTGVGKLFAALCFRHYDPIRKRLGILCAHNPLATQRMFELHTAAKNCGTLFELVQSHLERVQWHLFRIYRERNRIVHRANPSENVSALILNLNEYILVCMEAFFRAASNSTQAFYVDDIFSELAVREEARSGSIARVASEELKPANAVLVAGFVLQ